MNFLGIIYFIILISILITLNIICKNKSIKLKSTPVAVILYVIQAYSLYGTIKYMGLIPLITNNIDVDIITYILGELAYLLGFFTLSEIGLIITICEFVSKNKKIEK